MIYMHFSAGDSFMKQQVYFYSYLLLYLNPAWSLNRMFCWFNQCIEQQGIVVLCMNLYSNKFLCFFLSFSNFFLYSNFNTTINVEKEKMSSRLCTLNLFTATENEEMFKIDNCSCRETFFVPFDFKYQLIKNNYITLK